MSWVKIPSALHIPDGPSVGSNIFLGTGIDSGKYAFKVNGRYIISEQFTYSLEVGGTIFSPGQATVNGNAYWYAGSSYIYYSLVWESYIKYSSLGTEPLEYRDYDDEWRGSSFWSGYIPSLGGSSTFIPRGSNRGDDNKITVTQSWPRWESDTLCGIYEPVDGKSGNIGLGLPCWTDKEEEDGSDEDEGAEEQYGKQYIRSLYADISGHYSYGEIHYEQGQWIIGTIGSPDGWWVGSEPSLTDKVTFRYMNSSGKSSGEKKHISFSSYVLGDESTQIFLQDVQIWR